MRSILVAGCLTTAVVCFAFGAAVMASRSPSRLIAGTLFVIGLVYAALAYEVGR